jgi:hypothetical protein
MTTFATCWFCASPLVDAYYIPAQGKSIERVCYYCPEVGIQLTRYETLEDAQAHLIRIKMFGETP